MGGHHHGLLAHRRLEPELEVGVLPVVGLAQAMGLERRDGHPVQAALA
ncbi:MAG: hypothetical protein ACYTF3_04740 [Planctomycetota bacterium]